ncbi:MAG: deoxynucleoside kinase [Cytophagaceae bacterium]|nr:deoxynucleoside kinase [Cytophagaceae bacterium]
MHIAITGNIGAGKTTLAQKLADHFGWQIFHEAVEGNPYLSDFYGDMQRWAFHLQVYFLRSRYEQVLQINDIRHTIIQDRTIYEDAHIFARNLYQTGLMSARDYENYVGLFTLMISLVKPPDLMIYLRADIPKLLAQIKRRGREFEQNISVDYLTNLNVLYEEFTNNYRESPLLTIDVDPLDFAHREADWQVVLQTVVGALPEGWKQKSLPSTREAL